MKVTIVSDGKLTRVMTENGEVLEGVRAVRFEHLGGKAPGVTIELNQFGLDAVEVPVKYKYLEKEKD